MRVIAGEFKGRRLNAPRAAHIRPTSQKVKQALFSILGGGIAGASFLELFAGTGSIGIEAKSRGATRVYLVENNHACIKAIKQNLNQLKISSDQITVLDADVAEAIRSLHQQEERFDFVFLDPPYFKVSFRSYGQGQDRLKNSLINLSRYDILNPQSLVIAEHSKDEVLPQLIDRLRLRFSKRYGDAALSGYQKGA